MRPVAAQTSSGGKGLYYATGFSEGVACPVVSLFDRFRYHPVEKNRFIYLKYVDQVKQSVAQQNMVSILCRYPIFCDEDINNDRLTVVPISGFNDENQIPLCVLHRERKNLCSAEQILLEHILTCFQSSPP